MAADSELLEGVLKLVQAKNYAICETTCKIIALFLKLHSSSAVMIGPVILKHIKNNVYKESEKYYALRSSALYSTLPAL